MPKPKKRTFSVTKAVKTNARERIGAPPPAKVLPSTRDKAIAAPKHKETLTDLLNRKEDG